MTFYHNNTFCEGYLHKIYIESEVKIMNEKEMLNQLNDLLDDRKCFFINDNEASEIFKKDVKALELIINNYKKTKEANEKALRIIDKFKEKYIICFDNDLWGFVKRLEKCLNEVNL